MNSDTISRAAAIDAMMKLQAEDIEAYGASIPEGFDGDRAVTAIKALPSATDTNVGGNLSVDELITFLNPESNYVFYDDSHGFCINTQDVLDHLCAMPSAQLAQDLPNTCTDAIGRQAALDALDRLEYTPGEWATSGLTMCKDAIKALPSATDTNVGGNLIDRQAAISEIMEDIKDRSLHDDPATPEDYAEGYDEGIRNAAAIVLQMPSAQPDHIGEVTEMVGDVISRQAAIDAEGGK